MKRTLSILAGLFLVLTIAACTSDASNNQPAEPTTSAATTETDEHDAMLPYTGIWFSDNRSSQLIITGAYLYYHEFSTNREVYAEIKSADLVDNVIRVQMYAILMNGVSVGFDSPGVTLGYQFNGDQMDIILGNLSLSHPNEPVIFIHDEVLNE